MAARAKSSMATAPVANVDIEITPSPNWGRAMSSGPDPRVKITEAYARLVTRDAYFWPWPMVNIYNRRLCLGDSFS